MARGPNRQSTLLMAELRLEDEDEIDPDACVLCPRTQPDMSCLPCQTRDPNYTDATIGPALVKRLQTRQNIHKSALLSRAPTVETRQRTFLFSANAHADTVTALLLCSSWREQRENNGAFSTLLLQSSSFQHIFKTATYWYK